MAAIEGMARYLTAEHKPPKGKPKEDSTEPPTCHDHYRTCYGCPDRVAVPRCHMTCEGYKARQAEAERRNAEKRLIGSAYTSDEEFSKRLRNIQAAKDRKNRR